MENSTYVQARFRLTAATIFLMIFAGWLILSPAGAENSVVKLSDIQVPEGDIAEFQVSADSNYVIYRADQDIDAVNEIYSVPINFNIPPKKLNTPLVFGSEVKEDIQVSPNSRYVVFLTDQDTENVNELYSAPINGNTQPIKLNTPITSGFGVFYGFQISSDSKWVVYNANQDAANVYDLYSVPLDGSLLPKKLNGSLPDGGFMQAFKISNDGLYVVYSAEQDTVGKTELYSVPIDGSAAPPKLNDALSDRTFWRFDISLDSKTAVYSVKNNFMNYTTELYSVPIDGSADPIMLNETLGAGGTLDDVFQISKDSNWVVYIADYDYMSDPNLYSVPIDGSGTPIILNEPLAYAGEIGDFVISENNSQVVYRAEQDTEYVTELYSVPIDGSSPSIKLNNDLTSGNKIHRYQISADSSEVVYSAGPIYASNGNEMYRVPIDGTAEAVLLHNPLVSGGGIWAFQISTDGSRVVYVAEQETEYITELYEVPLDGATLPTKINEPLVEGGRVRSFEISADNVWVIYVADQDTDEVYELYAFGEPKNEISTQYLPVIVTTD